MHEWSLYIFTLALQAAIGGVVVLTLINYVANKGEEKVDLFEVNKRSLAVFSVLSLVGLVASFTHLGTPTNAINAINNIANSWMSREILLTSAFIGLTILALLLCLKQKKVNVLLLSVTAVVGLVDIFAMGSIYYVTIFPEWSNMGTILSFYGSAFILGTAVTTVLVQPFLKVEGMAKTIINISIVIALIGAVIELVMSLAFGHGLLIGANLSIIKWVLLGVGIILLNLYSSKGNTKIIYIALALMVIAEAVGRFAFYSVIG